MIVGLIKPLEGMRALAVLAVLLFHLDLPGFDGGYLGVDIFFIISGFIITKNILRQLEDGSFTLPSFYYKRFRRLFPALTVTVLVTLVASFFIVAPSILRDIGESSVWSLFSLANVHFWLEANYFDVEADRKPLLHMWSLGVEEQFYLFWPFLLLLFRGRVAKIGMIVALIIASFLGVLLLFEVIPNGIFYLFPFRIYQFLTGALLAVVPFQVRKIGSVVNLLALIAFGACISIMAAESYTTVVSGAAAAVVGFTMLISYDSKLAQIALGNPLMVWIGSRSYVIYLVHWPIIVLYKYVTGFELDYLEMGALFLASILLAELVARLVERPLRMKKGMSDGMNFFSNFSAVSVLAVSVFLAANFWGNDGYPSRISGQVSDVVEANLRIGPERQTAIRDGICHTRRDAPDAYFPDRCVVQRPGRTNILVIGDSIGADTWMLLNEGTGRNVVLSQATFAGCLATYPVERQPEFRECENFNRTRFEDYVTRGWDAVVIAGQWETEREISNLGSTINYVLETNENVVVFGPRPRLEMRPTDALETATDLVSFESDLNGSVLFRSELSEKMKQVTEEHGGIFVDIAAIQCPDETCKILDGDNLLYRDRDHITVAGAKYFAEEVVQEILPRLRSRD